jgi:glycosyltransferase involved in cell wall biosynthesis
MSSKLIKNTPIKICFISSHFPQGGAERQILELIKGLLKKEYKVTLMLYQSDQIFYNEILELDIKLILNKDKPSKNIFFKWINNIVFLRKNLKKKSFDILHTYLFYNGLIIRLFMSKIFFGKIIYSVRNSYESVSKVFYLFDKLLNKRSINIYNSKKSFEQLFDKPSKNRMENNLVIYNGFDTKKFYPSTEINDDIITIGMVGRMTFQKNQMQVLRVLRNLKGKINLPFRLYLIGDNNFKEGQAIKEFILNNNLSDEVILLDAQINIEDYYKKFDMFILSSLFEGCPNVLFEAMLSKCFCIISRGSNSDYYIKDGFNGFLYDGSDDMLELKLKLAIDLFLNNKLSDMRLESYNFALNNFSLNNLINNYDKVYKKISSKD